MEGQVLYACQSVRICYTSFTGVHHRMTSSVACYSRVSVSVAAKDTLHIHQQLSIQLFP